MNSLNVLAVNGNTKRADATYPVNLKNIYMGYVDPLNANRTYVEVIGSGKRQPDILHVDTAIATVITSLNATVEGFLAVTISAINGWTLPAARSSFINYDYVGVAYEVDSKMRIEYYGKHQYKLLYCTNALSALTNAIADITPGAETIAFPLVSKTVFQIGGQRLPQARTVVINENMVVRVIENFGDNNVARQAEARANMKVETVVGITAAGTGYTVGDVLTAVGGTGTAATFTVATVSGGAITGLNITTAGSYSVLPTNIAAVALTGGTGTGASISIDFELNTVSVVDAGYGYSSAPAVSFSGGGGTGAAATATVSGGVVTGFGSYTAGNNYTSIPSVSVAAPGNLTAWLFKSERGKEKAYIF